MYIECLFMNVMNVLDYLFGFCKEIDKTNINNIIKDTFGIVHSNNIVGGDFFALTILSTGKFL